MGPASAYHAILTSIDQLIANAQRLHPGAFTVMGVESLRQAGRDTVRAKATSGQWSENDLSGGSTNAKTGVRMARRFCADFKMG